MIALLLLYFFVNNSFKTREYSWKTLNHNKDYRQGLPAITACSNNRFYVAWQSTEHDGSDDGVFIKELDSELPEVQVNTYFEGNQDEPYVVCLRDNSIIVAWQSEHQDGNDYGIFAKKFTADLKPLTDDIQVNTKTDHHQIRPSVTQLPSGDLVFMYKSYNNNYTEIRAQKFDIDLKNKIGKEKVLTEGFKAFYPELISLSDGNLVFAYENAETRHGRAEMGIYLSKVNPDFERLHEDIFIKNKYIHGLDVIDYESNRIVAVWAEHGHKVMAQTLDYTLKMVGEEKQVAQGKKPYIVKLPNGNLAVSSIYEDDLYLNIVDKEYMHLDQHVFISKNLHDVNYNHKALAVDSNSRLVAVWSADQRSNFDIFYTESIHKCKDYKSIYSCDKCINGTDAIDNKCDHDLSDL